MAEQVPHPRLSPDQLDRVILELIGALPTPELRRQVFLHCLSQPGVGPRAIRLRCCRRTMCSGVWERVVACGVNWANCPGFLLLTGGAGVEPGVRSLGLCWSEGANSESEKPNSLR